MGPFELYRMGAEGVEFNPFWVFVGCIIVWLLFAALLSGGDSPER